MNVFFLTSTRSHLKIWSCETDPVVPYRVSPLILHTQAASLLLPTAFLLLSATAFNYIYRQPPSGQSRVYQAKQLRTDGVHCREAAGAGPVVLELGPVVLNVDSVTTNRCAAVSGFTMNQLLCASLFSHPPSACSGQVLDRYWTCIGHVLDMCDTESIAGSSCGKL